MPDDVTWLCDRELKKIGVEAVVTSDADVIKNADRIILPGVGAFGDAAKKLRSSGLVELITEEHMKIINDKRSKEKKKK